MLTARVPAASSASLPEQRCAKCPQLLTTPRRRGARCQRGLTPPAAQGNKQAPVQAEEGASQGVMSTGLTRSEILELQRVLVLGPGAVDDGQQEGEASGWGPESTQEITEEVGVLCEQGTGEQKPHARHVSGAP